MTVETVVDKAKLSKIGYLRWLDLYLRGFWPS
jgi:hypothetical protein